MSLPDGMAATFAGVFGGVYRDGTLYRAAEYADDGQGGGTGMGFDDGSPVKVQIDAATDAMQRSDGYVEGDVRILMLAHGVVAPDTDCEVAAGGARYMVETIGTDPCGSYYELRGRRK